MRIDLPCCGFKNCRYCFDGNCTKPSKQEKCEYWYLLHEEPERKKEKWDDIGGVIRYGCPFCHHAQERKSNFCPNCGADMRGEQDG